MNAAIHRLSLSASALITLRSVLAAGSWTNLLLVAAWLLAITVPRWDDSRDNAINLAPVLTAVLVMCWAMLSTSRLTGLTLQARRLQLPNAGHQALRLGLAVLLLSVVLPAMLLTAAGSPGFALNLLVPAVGLLLGVFWTSMPPWMMWAFFALGAVLAQFEAPLQREWERLGSTPALLLSVLAVVLLLANAGCWRLMLRNPGTHPWSTPLALVTLRNDQGLWGKPAQIPESTFFAIDIPVSHDLAQHPDKALAIALGPGFGQSTVKSVLAAQLPIIAVAVLWLLLNRSEIAVTALFFTPLLVVVAAFPPVMRLYSLLRLPPIGLHEPALLPGLPRRPATALAGLLTRQMLLRALPALAIMAATAILLGADHHYLLLLLWCCTASLMWLHAAILFALQSRLGRAALVTLMVLLPIAMVISAMPLKTPSSLLPLWSCALLAGALASAMARRRLEKRPHPWLQN
ncbi:MAG: hypothetical protein ACREP4_14850 [Stenotrophomonas sp.]|uniref:hypothetical protein n=1 Tax=Stenotrophomonas sp. TaxID=69392 RepID=UPI003D6CE2F8